MLFRMTSDTVEGGSLKLSDSNKVAASTWTTLILKSASWASVHLAAARGYHALVVEYDGFDPDDVKWKVFWR